MRGVVTAALRNSRTPEFSILVLVFVFVVRFLFDDVQFDRIESNYLQFRSTLFTSNDFALVRVQINVNISITFRASSGRHCFFLPRSLR